MDGLIRRLTRDNISSERLASIECRINGHKVCEIVEGNDPKVDLGLCACGVEFWGADICQHQPLVGRHRWKHEQGEPHIDLVCLRCDVAVHPKDACAKLGMHTYRNFWFLRQIDWHERIAAQTGNEFAEQCAQIAADMKERLECFFCAPGCDELGHDINATWTGNWPEESRFWQGWCRRCHIEFSEDELCALGYHRLRTHYADGIEQQSCENRNCERYRAPKTLWKALIDNKGVAVSECGRYEARGWHPCIANQWNPNGRYKPTLIISGALWDDMSKDKRKKLEALGWK